MDQAVSEKVKIGPYQLAVALQENQQNKTLIFLHGNSLSSQMWEKQFSSNLNRHFNLLAIDLPGHGNSSRAEHPETEYSIQSFCKILQDLIQHYQLKNFALIGHSLGGHIALESLPDLNGCFAVVIIGTPPLHKPLDLTQGFLPNPYGKYFFSTEIPAKDKEGFAKAQLRKNNPHLPTFILKNYKNTDPNLRLYMGINAGKGLHENEIQILTETEVPVTMVIGEEEQLINITYLLELPHKQGSHAVFTIPDAGHLAPYENPVYFNNFLVHLLSAEPTAL